MSRLLLFVIRLFGFSLLVGLGLISEATVDFLECMARGYRMGSVHPFDFSHDKGLIVTLGIAVVYVFGGLIYSLRFQEKVLNFKDFDFNQRITIIGALIVAALVMGYCYPPICGESEKKTTKLVDRVDRTTESDRVHLALAAGLRTSDLQ
jgi:hypothetical protein